MPTKMRDISTSHQEKYRTEDGNVTVTNFKPGLWQVMPRGHSPFTVGSKQAAFKQAIGIAARHWGMPKEDAFPPRRSQHATAKKKEACLDVVFRVFPDGDVIALFPSVDEGSGTIMSYQHHGQHAAASSALTRELRSATPAEYAPLLAELKRVGYCLRVTTRANIGKSGRNAHATIRSESEAKAHAEQLDRDIAPQLGKSRAEIARRINAIVRAADGRNVYLTRDRLGEGQVRRVIRARTKGRGMEVRLLDSGQWLGVLPELGDRIDVR